jgi:hypothetical protein
MQNFKVNNLKPFECVYINENSIYVNYGTVICTAKNSIDNIFIPKSASSIPLQSFEEETSQQANIINIGGAQKGCICLEIKLVNINKIIEEKAKEWKSSLFEANEELFANYLKKYVNKQYIEKSIGDLNSLKFSDPSSGLDDRILLTKESLINPKEEGAKDKIEILRRGLEEEKQKYIDRGVTWSPAYSEFYESIKKVTKQNKDKKFVRQPKEYIFNPSMLPLINFSSPISDVFIKFLPFSQNKEQEEKLIKYNFIINNTKLIPIAFFDKNSKKIIDQIIDFDYIFNFPFYYDQSLISNFLKEEES